MSLETTFRMAGALFAKLQIANPTKDKSVKAHLKELIGNRGVESEPATTATPRMLKLMTKPDGVIDRRYPSQLMSTREKVQLIFEGVGGCRVGEVTGAGDCHGLLANEVCILEDCDTGEVVVEGHLEHSKTGFARYLDMAGTTEGSGIMVAQTLVDYWRTVGIETRRRR